MSASPEDVEFMKLGVQYYVAARSAAWAGLLPVCGNLYHHALEMFLKAGLSRKHSLSELKSKFGHKLINIWDAFKIDFPSSELAQFDTTISDIDDFEDTRYPDKVVKHGAQMLVDWGSIPSQLNPSSLPVYKLNANDLDRLIGEIFLVSSRNPLFFTAGLKPDVREMLARDNPVAAQILGS